MKALEPYHPWTYEEVVQALNMDVMAELARKHIGTIKGLFGCMVRNGRFVSPCSVRGSARLTRRRLTISTAWVGLICSKAKRRSQPPVSQRSRAPGESERRCRSQESYVRRRNLVSAALQQRALDRILQFPHVAGERIRRQQLQDIRRRAPVLRGPFPS